ncbi:murein L,D-transpeptidase YafK [Mesorhizobium soli]|uniref:L,D-transpeptidase family protein n=1 Tax=Pseudaminobacter soli (ex Li et al. 2025) TaxID=1295366 RepID=UPI00247BDF60|nr:murein L,D-transpeptidase YafK [Mesorhizobium soli]
MNLLRRLAVPLAALALSTALAGCVTSVLDPNVKASQPIPASLVNQMTARQMKPSDPILVRIFKEESELEIWKRTASGRYALLKTYPMCRWSGQLGPKKRNGDRQAPEGFYQVTAKMLNPASQYYLSFDIGFPNKLENALGYTGESLMVHGACSSSGCYAMTDDGVSEIYSVVREALRGGQTSFQVQALPFRMTPQNMARHRGDPNMTFWKNLKEGYDILEVKRRPAVVSACGGHYVFDAQFANGEPDNPLAACPPMTNAPDPELIAKRDADSRAMEAMATNGTLISAHAYSDGGMHPSFRAMLEKNGAKELAKKTSRTRVPISRPDAVLVTDQANPEN